VGEARVSGALEKKRVRAERRVRSKTVGGMRNRGRSSNNA